jgi:ABC-type nitrate/sulfonate/bicarbonate transport system substrate-binding protein
MVELVAIIATIVAILSSDDLSHAASVSSKVVIAHGALNARLAPVWIAQEQKFFTKNGVEAEVILVRQIQVIIGGISTREIQIGYTSGSTLMGAAAGGLDVKMIAALNARVGYDLVTAPSIKTPKDLRGKRFGIQAFGGGLWMGAMLGMEHLGLDPQRDNINIIQVGDQTVLAQALETGRIDATALDGVFSRRLKQKGFVILAELNRANIPFIGLGMVTKSSFIRERSESLEGILKGLVEAIAFILSPKHKPVVLKTIMTHLRIPDPAIAEEGFQDLVTGVEKKPFPSVEGLRNIQRLLKIGNPKVENVKVEELVDDRILRKLDESGFISRVYSTYGVK